MHAYMSTIIDPCGQTVNNSRYVTLVAMSISFVTLDRQNSKYNILLS